MSCYQMFYRKLLSTYMHIHIHVYIFARVVLTTLYSLHEHCTHCVNVLRVMEQQLNLDLSRLVASCQDMSRPHDSWSHRVLRFGGADVIGTSSCKNPP